MRVNAYEGNIEVQSTSSNEKDLGKNDFFKILSAQLQFQDPLSGGDNSEYVAQLAQFSALEQMENLNKGLEASYYLQNVQFLSQSMQYGSELIGKEVTIKSEEGIVQGEVEKVRLNEGNVMIVVEGEEYYIDMVEEIEAVEKAVVNPQEIVSEGSEDHVL